MRRFAKLSHASLAALAAFSLVICPPAPASAKQSQWNVTLSWHANTEGDLAGYRIYQAGASGAFNLASPVAEVPAGAKSHTFHGLPAGLFRWVVTAVDEAGLESGPSEEASVLLEEDAIHLDDLKDDGFYGCSPIWDPAYRNQVTFTFGGHGGDLVLSYALFDVDFEDEVEVLVNGVSYGYVPMTENNEFLEGLELRLDDEDILDEGFNRITFRNTYNPPALYLWGVGNVAIRPPAVPLPLEGWLGNLQDGDRSHAEEVRLSFEVPEGWPSWAYRLEFHYRVHDVDSEGEILISLNGEPLVEAPVTENKGYSEDLSIELPLDRVRFDGINIITFDNTYNPPRNYKWGVGEADVVWEPLDGLIELPDPNAYGKIIDGDQSHVGEVSFLFEGEPGDLWIEYQAWDVDYADEVEILINGISLGFAERTPDCDWGPMQNLRLSDDQVQDGTANILTFDNTYNPPYDFKWGVGSVAILRPTIPLPARDAYSYIPGGDQTHVDRVDFALEGRPGSVLVRYRAWDADAPEELEILVNGVPVAIVPMTGDQVWGDEQLVLLRTTSSGIRGETSSPSPMSTTRQRTSGGESPMLPWPMSPFPFPPWPHSATSSMATTRTWTRSSMPSRGCRGT